jgi:hypothetical protein
MNKGFIFGATVTAIIGICLFFAYNSGFLNRFTQDRITRLGNECLEVHRDDFRDPRSVYVSEARFSILDDNKLLVNVKAKNGFGAYTSASISCSVIGHKVTRDWEAELDKLRQ